ncbi:MAG: glycosyltransferase family 2 protein [Desulfobacterales bacterium]|nr:glycosyltransferase family 2 protein [Desulfobacterales bacterium]
MNKTVDVTISLISHNSKRDLEHLLPSLTESLKDISHEILLIDNCSTDHTDEFIQQHYPTIMYRKNEKRLGYGANHNQNLKIAQGRYISLMNADILLGKDTFHKLIRFMDQHQDIGITAPNMFNEDQSLQYSNKRYPTITDLFIRRFVPNSLKFLFRKRIAYYEMQDMGYDVIMDVPFISGAFMFSRTDLIQELSGFDERFFMYFEDVDLCRRVQRTHRTVYYPDVQIIHRWERAAHKSVRWATVFSLSALTYFNKWGYQLY